MTTRIETRLRALEANGNLTVSVTGSVNVETGFLVPDSPFGDIAAQTSASDRAMRMLAKRIADDIRLKFASQ